jgi:hypothetical protein
VLSAVYSPAAAAGQGPAPLRAPASLTLCQASPATSGCAQDCRATAAKHHRLQEGQQHAW